MDPPLWNRWMLSSASMRISVVIPAFLMARTTPATSASLMRLGLLGIGLSRDDSPRMALAASRRAVGISHLAAAHWMRMCGRYWRLRLRLQRGSWWSWPSARRPEGRPRCLRNDFKRASCRPTRQINASVQTASIGKAHLKARQDIQEYRQKRLLEVAPTEMENSPEHSVRTFARTRRQ